MFRMYIQQHETLGPWYQKVARQPSWVTKAAILAAVLVIGIPLVLIALAALLVALAVFTALSLLVNGLAVLRQLLTGQTLRPPSAGRRNVRVIRR